MTLADAADRARHDLGKYVCFQARGLGEDASEAELRDALAQDLRRTRSGPAGVRGVAELWAELRPPLAAAGVEPIDALVADLAERAARLDTLDRPALLDTVARARALADDLRALARRLAE